jgi:hypothetical protein
MSCQTPVIVGDRKPSGGARGTPCRRQVTHGPYDPSFEMPDEGGPNERLTGDSIPGRVTPSRVQLAVSKPAQSSLFEPRLVRAPISAARYERTRPLGDPSQLSGCPNGSISRWPPTPVELLRPQMRLEYGLEAQRLLPYCCQEWSEAHRRNSKLYCLAIRAASLFA